MYRIKETTEILRKKLIGEPYDLEMIKSIVSEIEYEITLEDKIFCTCLDGEPVGVLQAHCCGFGIYIVIDGKSKIIKYIN
ncbi:hypothetical protein ACV3NC_14460 [Clostridium perfringens]